MSTLIDGRGPVTLILDTSADRTTVSSGTSRTRLRGVTGSSSADLV